LQGIRGPVGNAFRVIPVVQRLFRSSYTCFFGSPDVCFPAPEDGFDVAVGEILRASGPLGVLDARVASLSKAVQRVLLAPLLATAVAQFGPAVGSSGPVLQLAVVVRWRVFWWWFF
jgi:hypothetical protein